MDDEQQFLAACAAMAGLIAHYGNQDEGLCAREAWTFAKALCAEADLTPEQRAKRDERNRLIRESDALSSGELYGFLSRDRTRRRLSEIDERLVELGDDHGG